VVNAPFPTAPHPADLPDHAANDKSTTNSSNMAPYNMPPDVEPLPEQKPSSGSGFTAKEHRPEGPIGWFIYIIHLASKLCGITAAAMFTAAMFLISLLVFDRYVLNASTTWQTELVVYLMIGATLVGLPYVQLIRGHVNVDLFPMYLKRGYRKGLAIVILIVGMAISAMFGFYGIELVRDAYEGNWLSETVWAVPLWKPYATMPIGFGLLFLQFFADFLGLLTNREKPFDLPEDAV
jgi:TRAP-type C4-dicarboxylate transport system permease small subunit